MLISGVHQSHYEEVEVDEDDEGKALTVHLNANFHLSSFTLLRWIRWFRGGLMSIGATILCEGYQNNSFPPRHVTSIVGRLCWDTVNLNFLGSRAQQKQEYWGFVACQSIRIIHFWWLIWGGRVITTRLFCCKPATNVEGCRYFEELETVN